MCNARSGAAHFQMRQAATTPCDLLPDPWPKTMSDFKAFRDGDDKV
jgi:hypothetical protein